MQNKLKVMDSSKAILKYDEHRIFKEIPNKRNLKLVIREYDSKDSNDLIHLENEAIQIPFTFCGLLNFGKIFGSSFDYKCKKYKDSLMLVVQHIQEQGNTRICAGASLAIKDIYFNKQKMKAGYLFDLRVSEKYQRLGIGQALSQCLEEKAKAKGVEMLFLGVNYSNVKAITLYEKMGFVTFSKRKLYSESFGLAPIEPPLESKRVEFEGRKLTLLFKKVSRESAVNYLNKFYSNQNLALQDFTELTVSESYEGTYTVEIEDEEDQIVGASLVKIGSENFMGLKKFVVSPHHLLNPIYSGYISALILACFMPLIFLIQSALRDAIETNNRLADFIAILCFLVIAWILSIFGSKFSDVVRKLAGYQNRARVVGTFNFSQSKYSKILIQFLREEMVKVCGAKNIRSIMFNVDSNDSFLGYWDASSIIRTRGGLFMAKNLSSKTLFSAQDIKTDYMYFDPRDF